MRGAVTIAALLTIGCSAQVATSSSPASTYEVSDVDPAGFVRFTTDAGAEQRRQILIDAIWPEGLPTDVLATPLTGEPTNGYAIVHQGHMDENLSSVVDALVDAGYAVAVLGMPDDDHDSLFAAEGTAAMRHFLDPVIRTINGFDPALPVVMTGLSGGGWTTHMAAAIDTRIGVSVPVAGSLPLFARPFSPGSAGDAEQVWPAIYGEADTNGDGIPDTATGVASWLELYALATTGGRLQVQILNQYDPCCFSGLAHLSYSEWMTSRFPGWSIYIDDTHGEHIVSPAALLVIKRHV